MGEQSHLFLRFIVAIAGLYVVFRTTRWLYKDSRARGLSIKPTLWFLGAWWAVGFGGPIWYGLYYNYFLRKRFPIVPDVRAEFEKLGMSVNDNLFHNFRGYGVAIDRSQRKIGLGAPIWNAKTSSMVYHYKVYSYDQVRECSYNIQSGGKVHVFGGANIGNAMAVSLQAGMINNEIERENQLSSGLFFKLKDIEYPTWKVLFPPPQYQEIPRWFEIISQAFESENLAFNS